MGDFLSKFQLLQQALQGLASGFGFNTNNQPSPDDAEAVAAICPKTFWDKFIDEVNRTIKPLLLLSLLAMFHWAAFNPVSFTLFAKAISALPDMAWYTIFAVVSSWVVIRSIGDYRRPPTGTTTISTTTATTVTVPDQPPCLGRFGQGDEYQHLIGGLPVGNNAIAAWKAQGGKQNASRRASSRRR